MRNLAVVGLTAALIVGCEGESRTCTNMACPDPFTVQLQMSNFHGPTTVEIDAEGETATLDCMTPPEPGQDTWCEPREYIGERFRFVGELWNTEKKFMNVHVTELGKSIGPSNARVVVRAGTELLFDESFDAEYGEGREINGPGCGRCFGPVTFERSLSQLPSMDAAAPRDGG